MLPKLQEWMEDQYFDGLVRDASKRALGDIFSAATTEWKARVHNFPLINAIHLFCKLSRKITDKRLDERELTDSLEDWAKLLVSIAHFVGTDEHTLRQDAVYRFERATSLVHSRCQSVAAVNADLAHRLENRLNIRFEAAASWEKFEQQTAELMAKHFPNYRRPWDKGPVVVDSRSQAPQRDITSNGESDGLSQRASDDRGSV